MKSVLLSLPLQLPLLLLLASSCAARVLIGDFSELQHDVQGTLYALSEEVLEVENFHYDGDGPAAFFWMDTASSPSRNGRVAPDGAPFNKCATSINDPILGGANGITVRVEFPPGTSLRDYLGGSLSVWCERFDADFGHVSFPATMPEGIPAGGVPLDCSVEPSIADTPLGYNCEELADNYQVRWQVDNANDQLKVQLLGNIQPETYMGFGISGRSTETWMIGADAVIADWPTTQSTPRVRDIFMNTRAQCSGQNGVCLDTNLVNNGGSNDVGNVGGAQDRGLTMIEFTRPLSRTNAQLTANGQVAIDQAIDVTPGVNTFIVWAMGGISQSNGDPLIHNAAARGGQNSVSLDFGRSMIMNNCEPLLGAGETLAPTVSPPPPFERPFVGDDVTTITAHIGPSGGSRGYQAITGRPQWGIAWYLNGILIPRLILRRGTTYTFQVNSGDDPAQDSVYHPFYITDSPIGGYQQQTPLDRLKETTYADTIRVTESSPTEGVTGFNVTTDSPICIYSTTQSTMDVPLLSSFSAYADSLDMSCASDTSITDNAAIVTFTPDETTPDKLYYHCVTHTDLGYEIFILDEGEALPTDAPTAAPVEPADTAGFVEIALTAELAGVTMSYKINLADERANGQDTVSVILEAPVQGWLGWAVSTTGKMVGSEAIIGLPDTGEVLKYTMSSQVPSGVQPRSNAAEQTLIDASIIQVGSSTILSFTKILVEANEIPIDPNAPNTFLAAYGSGNGLGVHRTRGTFRLENLQGGSVSSIQTRKQALWKAHGWFAGIAWTVLSPLAIGAAILRRFIPGNGVWFQIHRGLNSLVILFTIIAFIIAVVAINQETPEGAEANHFKSDPNPHRLVGLVIFILALVQGINGIFRPHLPSPAAKPAGDDEEQPNMENDSLNNGDGTPPAEELVTPKSDARRGWEVGHRFIGMACLAMSWYQINAGIDIYNQIFRPTEDSNLQAIFWGVAGGLFGAILLINCYRL